MSELKGCLIAAVFVIINSFSAMAQSTYDKASAAYQAKLEECQKITLKPSTPYINCLQEAHNIFYFEDPDLVASLFAKLRLAYKNLTTQRISQEDYQVQVTEEFEKFNDKWRNRENARWDAKREEVRSLAKIYQNQEDSAEKSTQALNEQIRNSEIKRQTKALEDINQTLNNQR